MTNRASRPAPWLAILSTLSATILCCQIATAVDQPAGARGAASSSLGGIDPSGTATESDHRSHLLTLMEIEQGGSQGTATGQTVHLEVSDLGRRQWLKARTSDAVHLDVPLSSTTTVTLEMQRFAIVTSRTQFVVHRGGCDQVMEASDVLLLRGRVAGDPGSHAYLAVTSRGGGSGSITLWGGRRYEIRTLRATQAGARDSLTLQRSQSFMPPVDEVCRLIQDGRGCCAGDGSVSGDVFDPLFRGPRVLSIAIDTDHSYYELFGNEEDALDYIVQLVGAVSDIFLRDLDFHLVLGFARLWPDGDEPFSASSLGDFRNWWLNNMDMTGLNLVHMLSARRDLSYGGIAYLSHACTGTAFAISAYLNGSFPPLNSLTGPHLGIWDVNVVAHEIGHNLGSPHTFSYDPPIDTCSPGNEQRGTIMSYCHTVQGGLLNLDVRFHATVQQFIAAVHAQEEVDCLWRDCNGNGVSDDDDIARQASADFDVNGIPDECEMCMGSGVLNSQAIAEGEPDIQGNGIPDACETDCNGNGVPDEFEIAGQLSDDVNGNNIPDHCEPDCLGEGVPDFLGILLGEQQDIDRNAVPDACQDCTANGQPDWIDVERQFHLFVGLSDPSRVEGGSAVREYHRDSGVLVQAHGKTTPGPGGMTVAARDLAFGPDRQLYVVNEPAHNVVKCDVDTGEISVFIEAGSGGMVQPTSLTFGPSGDLYIASGSAHKVLRFDGSTGAFLDEFISAGSGGLVAPREIAFAPDGSLLVASMNVVRRFDGTTGAFLGTFASQGVHAPSAMLFPDENRVLIVNVAANNITEYDASGTFLRVFNDEFALTRPGGAAIGPDGLIYVSRGHEEVRIVAYHPEEGRYLWTFVRGDPQLVQPSAIAFRPASPLDADGSGLPDVCEVVPVCEGDLNGDGAVGVNDLLQLLTCWEAQPIAPICASADMTQDDAVGVPDLLQLLGRWGMCP